MGRETDIWPFVQARHYGAFSKSNRRTVKWIVVHDEEYPESAHSSKDIANYFATMTDGRVASAHIVIDSDTIIQCVHDNDIAYGAPGANANGIHIELAGYQRQTREEWLDEFGVKMLARASDVVSQYCAKYSIHPIHLTDQQLAAGVPGIIGHDQVTRVFQQGDHTDPGPNFPWDYLMARVGPLYIARLNSVPRTNA